MKNFLQRVLRISTMKSFYELNCETVLKQSVKSELLSIIFLLIEQYNYFAVAVNPNVIAQLSLRDPHINILGSICWTQLAAERENLIVMIQLGMNCLFLFGLVYMYLLYCAKSKEFMKSRFLSFYLQTFGVQCVPGLYLSLEVGGGLGYFNLILCIIMGVLYAKHSNNNYYHIQDFASKKQSNMEFIKFVMSFFLIVAVGNLNMKLLYFVPLIISIFSMGKFSQEMPYYHESMSRYSIQMNLANMVFSIILLIHIHNNEEKWLVNGLLCSIGFCYVLGDRLYEHRKRSIFSEVLQKQQRLGVISGRSAHPYESRSISSIEFVVRNLISYSKEKKSKEDDKSIILSQIQMKNVEENIKQHTQNEAEKRDKQQIINSFMLEGDSLNRENLNNYVCSLYENYFASKKSISLRDYGYLFYLLEESHNYPKLLVLIAEITRRQGSSLGLEEKATLNYLLHAQQCSTINMHHHNETNLSEKLIRRMMGLQKNSNSIYKNEDQDQKQEESERNIDLNQLFVFEDALNRLSENILRCTQAKMEILKCIGQDNIHLSKLRNYGVTFYDLRQKIEKEMYEVVKKWGTSIDIEILSQYFCESLCQDQLGFQEMMRSILRHSSFRENVKSNQNRDTFRKELSNIIDDLQGSLNGQSEKKCVIFVSLMMENLGKIRTVSNQFNEMFGYSRQEIIGQNCSVLQPQFMGEHHNSMLKRYIERGMLSNRGVHFQKRAVFAISKDGFCIPLEMKLQMHINQILGDAGLISQLSQKNKMNDALIIVDLNIDENKSKGYCLIETCSQKIFRDLFSNFNDSLHSLKRSSIDEFIPIFSHFLIPQLQIPDEHIHIFDLDTIAFFPKGSNDYKCLGSKTMYTGVTQKTMIINFKESTYQRNKQRTFDLEVNDLFVVTLKIQVLNDSKTGIKMAEVKFLTYSLIDNRDKAWVVENKLSHQFEELCGFDKEEQSIIQFLDSNHQTKMIQGFTQPQNPVRRFIGEEDPSYNFPIGMDDISIQNGTILKQSNTLLEIYERGSTSIVDGGIGQIGGITRMESNMTEGILEQSLMQTSRLNFMSTSIHPKNYLSKSNKQQSNLNRLKTIKDRNLSSSNVLSPISTSRQSMDLYSNLALTKQRRSLLSTAGRSAFSSDETNCSPVKIRKRISQDIELTRSSTKIPLSASPGISDEAGTQSPIDKEEVIGLSDQNSHILLSLRRLQNSKVHECENNDVKQKRMNLQVKLKYQRGKYDVKDINGTTLERAKQKKSMHSKAQADKPDQASLAGSRASQVNNEYSRNVKKHLVKKIQNNNYTPKSLKQMRVMIFLFFLLSTLYVIINQIIMSDLFLQKKRAFSFITWVMNLRNVANTISNEVVVGYLNSYPQIQYISDEQNSSLKASLISKTNSQLKDFQNNLDAITREPDSEGLVVLNELLNQDSTFSVYRNLTSYTNYTQKVLYHLFFIYEIQWERITNGNQLPIYNYDQNFSRISALLTLIQGKQQVQVNQLHSTILQQVNMSLIMISIISGIVFIDILIVFGFVQVDAERVLKLFATYDSEQIQLITDETSSQLKIFMNNLILLHLNGSSNNKQSNHFKEMASLQGIQCQKKKKKISQTTSLSKFNVKLLIYVIIIFSIMIVQPIANIIFTQQQILQSVLDSSLLGEIELARASLITGSVIPYFFVDKIMYPQRNSNSEAFYTKNLARVFPNNISTFSNLTIAIEHQREQISYAKTEYENFFFALLTQDACTPLQKGPQYFPNQIDTNSCLQIQNGLFGNGLLSGLLKYVQAILNLRNALSVADKALRMIKLKQHFEEYTILEIERCFELIGDLFKTLKTFIVKKNQDFFAFIQEIQIILMGYELITILLTFVFFLLQFIHKMQSQLKQAILILSVFEINVIFANTYTLHFLQQI